MLLLPILAQSRLSPNFMDCHDFQASASGDSPQYARYAEPAYLRKVCRWELESLSLVARIHTSLHAFVVATSLSRSREENFLGPKFLDCTTVKCVMMPSDGMHENLQANKSPSMSVLPLFTRRLASMVHTTCPIPPVDRFPVSPSIPSATRRLGRETGVLGGIWPFRCIGD